MWNFILLGLVHRQLIHPAQAGQQASRQSRYLSDKHNTIKVFVLKEAWECDWYIEVLGMDGRRYLFCANFILVNIWIYL